MRHLGSQQMAGLQHGGLYSPPRSSLLLNDWVNSKAKCWNIGEATKRVLTSPSVNFAWAGRQGQAQLPAGAPWHAAARLPGIGRPASCNSSSYGKPPAGQHQPCPSLFPYPAPGLAGRGAQQQTARMHPVVHASHTPDPQAAAPAPSSMAQGSAQPGAAGSTGSSAFLAGVPGLPLSGSMPQLQPHRLLASSPPWSSPSTAATAGSKARQEPQQQPQQTAAAAAPAAPRRKTAPAAAPARAEPASGHNRPKRAQQVQQQVQQHAAVAAGAAAVAVSPGPSAPTQLWMRLLGLLVGLAGRVLHALALTFCLVALLLLRPRALGATTVATAASATPAAAVAQPQAAVGGLTQPSFAAKPSSKSAPPFASMTAAHLSMPIAAAASARHAQASSAAAPGRTSNPVATLSAEEGTQLLEPAGLPGEAGSPAAAAPLSGPALLAAQEAAVTSLFKAAQASVVNISGARAAGTFSSLDVSRAAPGLGSGFLWDERGHVVTAYSCVRGAAEVKVTLADAATFTAKLVGWDAGKDVAVLRLSVPKARLKELSPVQLGRVWGPGGLALGAPVWALGNATGLDHTLTQGIVSGLGRELPGGGPYPLKGLIQTDAACGHQAGGVLLNAQGRVVGMLVAPSQAGGRDTGYGLGYALPVDAVRGLVTQILASGKATRPTLGVTLAPPQVLGAQGVEGVLVLEVPPGSPAAVAGLRHTHRDIFGDVILGDVIVGIEAMPVCHAGDLYAVLDTRKAGERVRVDILRDGKATSLTLTLGERGQAGALEE